MMPRLHEFRFWHLADIGPSPMSALGGRTDLSPVVAGCR